MSYVNRILYSLKLRSLLIILVSIFGFMMLHGTAAAAGLPMPSSTLPESSDFSQGNNVWLTVANADGSNFLLTSLTSVVRIYSESQNITLTIHNPGHCPNNGPDQGANENEATTRFEFHALAYNPIYTFLSAPYSDQGAGSAAPSVNSDSMGCGDYPVNLTGTSAVPANANEYAQNGKYAFEIRAIWTNTGAFGWNQFKYSVNVGRLSYYAGSGDHFALKADDNQIYPGGSGNFWLGFAPNCKLDGSSAANATVRWFDADAGQPNQGGQNPVRTKIIEYNANNSPTGRVIDLDINTGNGVGGSFNFIMNGHHKYAWEWEGIRTANGIQFQLPTDSYNTLIDFDNDCASTVASASCTATPSPAKPKVGVAVDMTVVIRNTSAAGGPSFNSSYQVRQVSPGGQVKNISGTLSPGESQTLPKYAINARASPQSVNFQYRLFDGSGNPIGNNPLCSKTVTWTDNPAGGGSISTGCKQTIVSGLTTTATYTHTTTTTGTPYLTYQPPPYPVPPDPARSPFIPGVKRYTYTPPPTPNIDVRNATDIPIRIRFFDSSGAQVAEKLDVLSNTGEKTYDTFADPSFQALWPHLAYRATLEAQTSGSLGEDQGGEPPGHYSYAPVDESDLSGNCLNAACGSSSPVEAEPGQTKNFSYGIQITNDANRAYSSNEGGGYHFGVGTNGGLSNVNNISARPDIEPGPTNINVSFSARVNQSGQFWIVMYFQGGVLATLDDLPGGDCGNGHNGTPGTASAGTRPYFQVTGGDLNAGGGFGNPADGQCVLNDPSYISPITGAGYNTYSGGIRAYGTQSAGLGSSADFGVLALGLNIGSSNGTTGLFSKNGAVFASATGGNMGGLLNQNGLSQWHCINDFFTKTRKVGPAPSSFGGGAVPGSSLQYSGTGSLSISASNIARGQQTTIYVDGDVTITGNITYAKIYDPTVRSDVPYFSLIVKGNIYVAAGVTQLDGLYVAQPTGSGTGSGVFATCDNPNRGFCANQLVVNGAVIAQQVELLREFGTLGPLDADPNHVCGGAFPASCPPAEVFNYIPAMIIGQPNFAQKYTPLESIFNLPPVF